MEEQLTPERMAEIKNILKDIQVDTGNSSLIQDNKILFKYNDEYYRCRMPNQYEQSEAELAQNKAKIKLSQEEGTITRKRLIQVLKEKQDIDINELYKEKDKLRSELQGLYLEWATIPSDEKERIEEYREKKSKIEEKFMEVTIEIVELLAPCIEEQSKMQYYKYLAFACTDKKIEEKFESVWKTFEDFQKDATGLTYKALENIQSLLLHTRE